MLHLCKFRGSTRASGRGHGRRCSRFEHGPTAASHAVRSPEQRLTLLVSVAVLVGALLLLVPVPVRAVLALLAVAVALVLPALLPVAALITLGLLLVAPVILILIVGRHGASSYAWQPAASHRDGSKVQGLAKDCIKQA
jgi:hypothetical protein